MLYNKDVHTRCFCYETGVTPVVERREFPRAARFHVQVYYQEIIVVMEGRLDVVIVGTDRKCRVRGGQFAFIPNGSEVSCRAAAGTSVVSFRITTEVPECHVFRVNKVAALSDCDKMHVATVNPRVAYFMGGIVDSLADGFRCRIYLEMEVSRLLFLIHAYYSHAECLKLFAPIVTPNVQFSEFVRLNHLRLRTVGAMAAELNMSNHQFTLRFRKVMGISPREWIQEQKARSIYHSLCQSEVPIKEVATEYDFSPSNFIRYCRTKYGMPPGMIRKRLAEASERETATPSAARRRAKKRTE
jgi:AraC-like DNA-binding protein/mannose-6-phosphate isomerase-like protein (cupin superfamily)